MIRASDDTHPGLIEAIGAYLPALTAVTPNELLVAMRGAPEHTERSYLRIYMQQWRRKLEVDPARAHYLLTEPGRGYRYQPGAATEARSGMEQSVPRST